MWCSLHCSGIDPAEGCGAGVVELGTTNRLPVDEEVVARGHLTQENGVLYVEFAGGLYEDAAVLIIVEQVLVETNIHAHLVAERHFRKRLTNAAKS